MAKGLAPGDCEALRAPSSHGEFGYSLQSSQASGKLLRLHSFYAPVASPATGRPPAAYAEPAEWAARSGGGGGALLDAHLAAFAALGGCLAAPGTALAAALDAYVSRSLGGSRRPGLARSLAAGVHKARALCYETLPAAGPGEVTPAAQEDGVLYHRSWHSDFSSLSSVAAPLFADAATGAEVGCPDTAAGLYVRSGAGREAKVAITRDAALLMIGDAAEVHSVGVLRATQHRVRAAAGAPAGVVRATAIVFLHPAMDTPMASLFGNDGRTGVQTFGEFAARKQTKIRGDGTKMY
jgi:hypothetical protein